MQNIPKPLHWFVTEDNKAKAYIKYEFKYLFREENPKSWLHALIDLCNQGVALDKEPALIFYNWNLKALNQALQFFSNPELVNLANAIFFYKLYPDQLFKELIHPEKLVSVRLRLRLVYDTMELLQGQLYSQALQQGLKPGIDFLFHGDELPKGIRIEVKEEYRIVIQSAIKHLKFTYTSEDKEQLVFERLLDLGRAYKYWFNPNRLIDTVMMLREHLCQSKNSEPLLSDFNQGMLVLFKQLTTTACFDLYGYFANNDSRYLLYTLYAISHGNSLDWLPPLNSSEKLAITKVFETLQCVMEALRIELKHRHVTTEPYINDFGKQLFQVGRRNRDAVFRLLVIYGQEKLVINDTMEKLFNYVET